MKKEKKISNEVKAPCDWCGMVDERKKVYASPGDDLENPSSFHEECLRAFNYFTILRSMNTDKDMEDMIKLANKLAKIEIETRK